MTPRAAAALLLAAALPLTAGCVRRSLTIKSDPPGAMAYLNDRLVGSTPVTFDFQWYGWHRLTLRKDGYERVDDRQQLRAPLYLWIPLDLLAELLPVPVRDAREWSYALDPLPQETVPVSPPPVEPGTSSPPETTGAAP